MNYNANFYLGLKIILKMVYIDAPTTNPINDPTKTKKINIGNSISAFGLDCQDTTVAANQIPPKNPHNILVQLNPDVFGLFLTEVLGIVATVIINPISLIVI